MDWGGLKTRKSFCLTLDFHLVCFLLEVKGGTICFKIYKK